MKEIVQTYNAIFSWFFEKGEPRTAACLRIAYALLFLFMLWDIYPYLDLLMGHSGIYGSLEKEFINFSNPFTLLYRFDLPWQIRIWFWTSVGICCLVILGLWTRISIVLMFFSLLLFQARAPFALYGADNVLFCSLIWLLFLNCNQCWSLDNLLKKNRGIPSSNFIEAWPMKCIQIQIAIIYFFTGFHKVGTESWKNGSAVYYAIQSSGLHWVEKLHLIDHKILLVLMTYYSLLAELSFVFLVFRKSTRFYAILAVFLMHFGVDLLMDIRFFSLTMYAGYLAFLNSEDWKWIFSRKVFSGKLLSNKKLCDLDVIGQ